MKNKLLFPYHELDPGVQELVALFHKYKIRTTMSCEGHKYPRCRGLFPHSLYIEISGQSYRYHEVKFKQLADLARPLTIRLVNEYWCGSIRYFVVVSTLLPTKELLRMVKAVWDNKIDKYQLFCTKRDKARKSKAEKWVKAMLLVSPDKLLATLKETVKYGPIGLQLQGTDSGVQLGKRIEEAAQLNHKDSLSFVSTVRYLLQNSCYASFCSTKVARKYNKIIRHIQDRKSKARLSSHVLKATLRGTSK